MRRLTHAVAAAALVLQAGSLGVGSARAAGASPSVSPPSRGVCRGELTLPTSSNSKLMDTAVLCLIDRERAHYRFPALRPNPDLQGIASTLSSEMAAEGYFGDDSEEGETPWQRIASSPYAWGAQTLLAAQNIGWGTDGLATPMGIVNEWMHSAPHRKIILTSSYRDVGAGVAPIAPSSLTDERPGATYTVEFAARG
jgi:uncharacterized protein YkwD